MPHPAPTQPSILELMRETILPRLQSGEAQLIPLTTAPVNVSAGFEEVFPYGTQAHPSFEWVWPVGDWTHIKIGKSIYLLEPGDFCLIPPGVSHAEVYNSSTPVHSSLWFTYAAYTATISGGHFVYDSYGHGYISENYIAQVPPIFGTLLVSLQNEIANRDPHAEAVCRSLLQTLAYLLVRHLEKSALPPFGKQATGYTSGYTSRLAIDYMRQHYAENISLDDIAHAVHLSRNYLATVFKRETGKTIVTALTEIRLEHARHLLVQQRHSVRDVAAAVGFRSPEHFCRVFQRHENVAPSFYAR